MVAAGVASASWQLLLAGAGAGLGRVLTGPAARRWTAVVGAAVVLALAVWTADRSLRPARASPARTVSDVDAILVLTNAAAGSSDEKNLDRALAVLRAARTSRSSRPVRMARWTPRWTTGTDAPWSWPAATGACT